MSKIFFLIFSVIFHFLAVFGNGRIIEIQNFGKNDGNLKLFIHPPKNTKIGNQPLVIVLHGCSQDALKVSEQSGWSELADIYNFIVIYPEQKITNNVSNCFNWFYKKDIDPKTGESSSILEMVNYMKSNYSIDASKIFIYGLSAGAAMTVNLLANSPETFNAGASLAGGAYGLATNFLQAAKGMMSPPDKTPQEWGELVPKSSNNQYPKLIVLHGTNDNTVDFRNANELIEQWTDIHKINLEDKIITEKFDQNPLVQQTIFKNQNNEAKVIFYAIKNLGHALPVDPGTSENQGGATGMFAVDCDFFSTYFIAKDFGLIPCEIENK